MLAHIHELPMPEDEEKCITENDYMMEVLVRQLYRIDVFPILFDVRGLRPDMLCFPRFSL